jgi:cysteine-rich repeat protein
MRSTALLTLLLVALPGLAGCPAQDADPRVVEREAYISMHGRMVHLLLAHEDGITADHQALPALGDSPERIGGGLRRVDLTLEVPERLAVVLEPSDSCTPSGYELDCRSFTRTELEGAVPGQTLPSGGFLAGLVEGRGQVALQAPLPAGRLTLVRLDRLGEDPYVIVRVTARFEFNLPLAEPLLLSYGEIPGRCGNGLIEPGEQCDDENAVAGDGCNSSCWRESSYCTGDGRVWLSACDEAEPSRCESRACAPDDPDARCHERTSLRAATFLMGRFSPAEAVAARLASTPAGLDCACGHEVVGPGAGRECAASCVVDLPACATAVTATAGADAPLASWGHGCWGTGTCWAPGIGATSATRVMAAFATADAGLDLARPLVDAWPGWYAPTPAAVAATADGGVLVAVAYTQPFVFAGQSLTADGPSAMIARLRADGSLAWLRRLSVRPGEEVAVHAVAADAADGAVLVGAFRGRLDASGLDLQSGEYGTRELFVAGYGADGTARFATRVELGTAYWTTQAAVAAADGVVALAATVRPAGGATDDLALVALDGAGAVKWSRLVLGGALAGHVVGRGVGLLPGGDWLVAGVHAADGDAGAMLPPRTGAEWVHFVTRLAPDGAPVWTAALGETADASRPSAFAVDRAAPGAWATVPQEPAGNRLVRLDGAGAVAFSTPVTAEDYAPRLGVDPATGDALLAGNGAAWVADLDMWEVWLARVTAAGDVAWSERHPGSLARGLSLEALAVAAGGRALLLAAHRTTVTIAGATLRGCDSYGNACTGLALLGAAP